MLEQCASTVVCLQLHVAPCSMCSSQLCSFLPPPFSAMLVFGGLSYVSLLISIQMLQHSHLLFFSSGHALSSYISFFSISAASKTATLVLCCCHLIFKICLILQTFGNGNTAWKSQKSIYHQIFHC